MAIDERARHQLYLRLEEHLGPEAATTLMEHLPPTGWAEVATKRDLDHVEAILNANIDRTVEKARADLHKTISTHTVAIVFTTLASTLAGVFAVAQLR
jgi:hypothetical protein